MNNSIKTKEQRLILVLRSIFSTIQFCCKDGDVTGIERIASDAIREIDKIRIKK
jgi:hypothetical protein